MADLKITVKTTHRVDYSDLNDFVRELTDDAGFDVLDILDYPSNDSSHEATADPGFVFDWERIDYRNWREDGCTDLSIDALMSGLASEGLIPSGEYLIRVSW